MYKEAKNLKPGDRISWKAEFILEITAAPRIHKAGCRLTVLTAGVDPFQRDEDGNQTVVLPSPKTRLRYLGNITQIEQQIRQLTQQKAKLQGALQPAGRGKQPADDTQREPAPH